MQLETKKGVAVLLYKLLGVAGQSEYYDGSITNLTLPTLPNERMPPMQEVFWLFIPVTFFIALITVGIIIGVLLKKMCPQQVSGLSE